MYGHCLVPVQLGDPGPDTVAPVPTQWQQLQRPESSAQLLMMGPSWSHTHPSHHAADLKHFLVSRQTVSMEILDNAPRCYNALRYMIHNLHTAQHTKDSLPTFGNVESDWTVRLFLDSLYFTNSAAFVVFRDGGSGLLQHEEHDGGQQQPEQHGEERHQLPAGFLLNLRHRPWSSAAVLRAAASGPLRCSLGPPLYRPRSGHVTGILVLILVTRHRRGLLRCGISVQLPDVSDVA